MPLEVEIKLPIRDLDGMRRSLLRAGFRPSTRSFEDNFVFDTPDGKLRRNGQLLRLREYRRKAVLTFKSRLAGSPRYKVRAEEELLLSSCETMRKVLERLGYRIAFRYQKYRTPFRSTRETDLNLYLDETPIGIFLELEGRPATIERVARRLGFRPADYVTLTYADLYARVCRQEGKRPSHMLFVPAPYRHLRTSPLKTQLLP